MLLGATYCVLVGFAWYSQHFHNKPALADFEQLRIQIRTLTIGAFFGTFAGAFANWKETPFWPNLLGSLGAIFGLAMAPFVMAATGKPFVGGAIAMLGGSILGMAIGFAVRARKTKLVASNEAT